ncbi:unnamed protein product [Thelazia callipaeda]|uniref:Uncharacterized protein n=1 Tax=Thelazia callipaeda TaxID=103827 RepID=A0A0N5DA46_THECL|nr:unnamed protein product [Thelazia callipaeda]
MGDLSYGLPRVHSTALFHSSRPRILITATKTTADPVNFIKESSKYKPQWSYMSCFNHDLYDDIWYNRYVDLRPEYRSLFCPRRFYHSDIMPNPHYWSGPYTVWTKHKGFW